MYQISGPHNPIFENYGGAGPSTSNHQQEIQERTAKEKRDKKSVFSTRDVRRG